MSKKIRFFIKSTGEDAPSNDYFIESDGTVWRDNGAYFESQQATVDFSDFVMPCPDIDWELLP